MPSMRRLPFSAPSSPASIFSATYGARYPFIRNFLPVNVKSGTFANVIWHWLQVNPVCRTNDGTALAEAAIATIPNATSEATNPNRRILNPPGFNGTYGSNTSLLHLGATTSTDKQCCTAVAPPVLATTLYVLPDATSCWPSWLLHRGCMPAAPRYQDP